MNFVQIAEFDWLPWQHKGLIFKKIFKNQLLRSWGIKLKLCRIVSNNSLYQNIVFLLLLLKHFGCYGNFKFFHCLIMGKVKIEIYCYLIADSLTKVLQKCYWSSPLQTIQINGHWWNPKGMVSCKYLPPFQEEWQVTCVLLSPGFLDLCTLQVTQIHSMFKYHGSSWWILTPVR